MWKMFKFFKQLFVTVYSRCLSWRSRNVFSWNSYSWGFTCSGCVLCPWSHRLLSAEALLLSASFLAEQVSDGKGWSCCSSFYLVILILIPSERILFFKTMCRSVSAPYSGGLTYESFCVFYFSRQCFLSAHES